MKNVPNGCCDSKQSGAVVITWHVTVLRGWNVGTHKESFFIFIYFFFILRLSQYKEKRTGLTVVHMRKQLLVHCDPLLAKQLAHTLKLNGTTRCWAWHQFAHETCHQEFPIFKKKIKLFPLLSNQLSQPNQFQKSKGLLVHLRISKLKSFDIFEIGLQFDL